MLRKLPSLLQLLRTLVLKHSSVPLNQLVAFPQRPLVDDYDAWHAYWKAQGQAWRWEPEIDAKRQKELAQCRCVVPDVKKGIYPFKGMRLNRADIEWLLATHDGGRGPVNWSDESQRKRTGLDLRGANLYQEYLHELFPLHQVHFRELPLSCLSGGLGRVGEADGEDWTDYFVPNGSGGMRVSEEARNMAAVKLQSAYLYKAQLQGALLYGAQLQGACLEEAQLQEADLCRAQLQSTNLYGAQLQGANFRRAQLQGANLRRAQLQGANLENVILSNENQIGPQLADVQWSDVDLTVVNWSQVRLLGDEYWARQKKDLGLVKKVATRLHEYERAVRANRQLATALQAQGLNEDAARFAYRAQALQKYVFWFQMIQKGAKLRQRVQTLGAWLFSWFLFLLAGYGYRLWRSFLAYALVIIGFTMAYYLLGASFKPPLSLVDALGLSMTSFHGRGFFPGVTQLNDLLTILASIEAFVGLILEATFIATLTQRFFGK